MDISCQIEAEVAAVGEVLEQKDDREQSMKQTWYPHNNVFLMCSLGMEGEGIDNDLNSSQKSWY